MITVNGQEADPGCFIDGHWGQYGSDRLAEVCEEFDLNVPWHDDPRHWRQVAEAESEEDSPARTAMKPEDAWQRHHEAADTLLDKLNDVTSGGYWTWQDGELFLAQTEVDGWLYVPADDDFDRKLDYDEAWQFLVENGPAGYATFFDSVLPTGEKFFKFRITVHYEPEG